MPRWARKELEGWGRVWRATTLAARPERASELEDVLKDAPGESLLAYGAGRSYGDAALNSRGRSVVMTRLDRFLDFDPATRILNAEAGVTFSDLISTFLPRGYMPPVVPGTGFATLGGGVANDVHGKNHHQAGSLGQHLDWIDLRLPSGELRRVSTEQHDSLFRATLGGVGLTGIIERLGLRLKSVPSNAVTVRTRRIRNLDEYFDAFAEEQERAEYIVGWIDALASGHRLGRGILEAASPSPDGVSEISNSKRVPFDFPAFALNRLTVQAFNEIYFRRVSPAGDERRLSYHKFLFPLDSVHDWNRIYGKPGFHQFQCVVPFEAGRPAIRQLLSIISRSGKASFLAVLKAMGPTGLGYLSFPRPGYTLALDFPNSPAHRHIIAELESITCDHGGRTYLAKDSTLSPANLRRMYPQLHEFQAVVSQVDPGGRMGSDLSRRLQLTQA